MQIMPAAGEYCKGIQEKGGKAARELVHAELKSILDESDAPNTAADFERLLAESKAGKVVVNNAKRVKTLSDSLQALKNWKLSLTDDLFGRSKVKEAEKNLKTGYTAHAELSAPNAVDDTLGPEEKALWQEALAKAHEILTEVMKRRIGVLVDKLGKKLEPLTKIVSKIPDETHEVAFIKYMQNKSTGSGEMAKLQKDVEQALADVKNACKRSGNEAGADIIPEYDAMAKDADNGVTTAKGSAMAAIALFEKHAGHEKP